MMTTPQNLPYGTALTGSNAQAWAEQILSDLGAPETAADIQSLMDWFAREGGGGVNNPLNTTLRTSGSTGAINSVGVQSYSTPTQGASAEAQTIAGGNYPNILADLKAGTGLIGASNVGSELSTWSGGGYSSVSGSPSIGTISTPSPSGQTAQDQASLFGINLGIFQSFSNFFTDVTSADLWERIGLMIFGLLLFGVGIIILVGPTALQLIGVGAKVGRGTRSIARSFGGGSQDMGPSPQEVADRQERFKLAQYNAETGRLKVENVQRREARLSVSRRHASTEPNPEPPHS